MTPYRSVVTLAGILSLVWVAGCGPRSDAELVKMNVHGLQVVPWRGEVAVLLTDENGERFLPISVGRDQAVAIQLGRKGESAPRPLSHDLMATLLRTLDAEVEQVTITDLKDDTYYAEIVVRHGRDIHRIDARPSDAIALALRTQSPIYAVPDLLREFGEGMPRPGTGAGVQTVTWGFSVQELTQDLTRFFGEAEGVLVADVRAGSPADRAGLIAGDILIRIENQRTRDLADVQEALEAAREAESLEVVVVRGAETVELVIER